MGLSLSSSKVPGLVAEYGRTKDDENPIETSRWRR
jgi:hypothetical protein